MLEWFHAIETHAAVQAVKSSFLAYPLINATHILGIGVLVTSVLLMDLRLLGRFPDIAEGPFVRLLRRTALVAFCAVLITGITMFAVRASDYAASRLFWSKMTLILLAGLNFAALAAFDRDRPAGASLRPAARVLVIFSMLLWLSVLVVGRFLGFV